MSDRAAPPALARNAVGVGLAALIPVPLLDEAVRRRLLRSSYTSAAADAGVALDEATVRLLAEDRGSFAVAVLVALFWWPIRKLFRTVLYFLTLKDVLDWTTEAALRAEMVYLAAARGLLPGAAGPVRDAMDEVLGRHRYSPVSRPLLLGERAEIAWPGGVQLTGFVGRLCWLGGGGHLLERWIARLDALVAQGGAGAGDGGSR